MNVFFRSAGEGRPIVLLHGVPTSSYLWRNCLEPLSAMGRVVAPDLFGFGQSDKPPDGDYSLRGYVEFLCRFLEEHDLQPTTLVGHDLGGLLAIGLAIEQGHRLRRLVLTNTSVYPDPRVIPAVLAFGLPLAGTLAVRRMSREHMAGVLRSGMGSSAPSEEMVDVYWQPYQNLDARLALLRAMRGLNPLQILRWRFSLGRIACPTLIVWGARDPFFSPSTPYKLQRDIPGARLHILENAGHFLQEDEPEAVSDLIARFVREA